MQNKQIAQQIIKMHNNDQWIRDVAVRDPKNKKKIRNVYKTDKKHYQTYKAFLK